LGVCGGEKMNRIEDEDEKEDDSGTELRVYE
jgi:hypothetical protein